MKHSWILIVALVGMGCVDGVDDADCGVDCEEWEVAEGDADEDRDEPGRIVQGLGPCAPVAGVAGEFDLPEIPEEVRSGTCPLEREVTTSNGQWSPAERVINWESQGDELVQIERVDGEELMRTVFVFAQDGEEIERIERRQFYSYTSYSGVQRYRYDDVWEFDGQGRVLRHHHIYTSVESEQDIVERESEVIQSFSDGRLVRRVETNRNLNGVREMETSWSYDDAGRLKEAVQVSEQREDRAVWEYEAELPVEVSRYVDGTLVEQMSWEFDGERLVSRGAQVGVDDEEEEEGEPAYFRRPAILDSYALQSSADSGGYYYHEVINPWSGANAHLMASEDSSCYELPATLGHGYPEDENSYFIGFSPTTVPEPGMEYAYGFRPYYYSYITPAWFGHMGVGSMWLTHYHQADRRISSRVNYNEEGRMISESMEKFYRNPEIEPVAVTRERQFDGSDLVNDEIDVQWGEERVRAALHFERNDEGSLLRRDMTIEDELVSFQQWSYEEASEPVSSQVHVADIEGDNYYYDTIHPVPTGLVNLRSGAPQHTLTLEREFDELGREVSYREDQIFQESQMERDIIWGDHGMREKSEYRGPELEYIRHDYWEYDESGEVVTKSLDSNGDDMIDQETRYIRDEAGREVERVELNRGAVSSRVAREFGCQ